MTQEKVPAHCWYSNTKAPTAQTFWLSDVLEPRTKYIHDPKYAPCTVCREWSTLHAPGRQICDSTGVMCRITNTCSSQTAALLPRLLCCTNPTAELTTEQQSQSSQALTSTKDTKEITWDRVTRQRKGWKQSPRRWAGFPLGKEGEHFTQLPAGSAGAASQHWSREAPAALGSRHTPIFPTWSQPPLLRGEISDQIKH